MITNNPYPIYSKFKKLSTINGKSYQDPRNINLKGGAHGVGLIRWTPPVSGVPALWSSNPFSTNDYGLYINASGQLVFSSTGTTTILGAAGGAGGGVPSWEQIYSADKTMAVTTTTFTIDGQHASNDVLTLTDTLNGSGDLLQITNTGTGKDVNGTSSTWSVTKAGVAVFTDIDSPLITSSAALTIAVAGANVITVGTGSNTITMAKATTFSSTIVVTDALTDLISTSNSAAALRITNNTASTLGNGVADLGVAVIRSTSLTTGDLLRLQTDASLTAGSGNYLNLYDTGLSSSVFSITELGVTVIAGLAGSASFTLTAGDMVLSDGSVSITDADDAASLSVINNTATTAAVISFVSTTGIFTGTTTGSYAHISHSGLTTGTLLRLTAVAADTSVGVVDIATMGLTSGSALRITANTGVFTTGGKLIELSSTAAVAGNFLTATTTGAYSGTGQILLSAGAMVSGVQLSIVNSGTAAMTTGSQIRTSVNGTAAIATNGIISFTHTGVYTSTSATDGGFVEIKANSTTAGTILNVVGSGLTTGVGLQLSNGTSAITTGALARFTASGTGTIAVSGAVGGIVSIRHAGIFLSTANAGVLDVRASALVGAGTLANFMVTSASQTAANIMNIEQSGATITAYTGSLLRVVGGFSGASSTGNIIGVTAVNDVAGDALLITNNALTLGAGTLINLVHGTSVLGAGSSMLRITSTGVDTGTTTGVLLDLAATAATSGVLALVTSATLDSGKGLLMNLNGLTTGAGIHVAHTTAVIASGGSLMRLSSTSVDTGTTTGVLLDLSSTASLAGTQVLGTFSGLTTGIGMSLVAAAMNSGTLLKLTATEANLSSGKYIACFDGAANDFSVARYGATVIAGNAALTAALTLTKGDLVMSDGVFQVGTTATVTADAGSVQGGNPITNSYVEISICATGGDSVTLPAAVAGRTVIITNHGAAAADVFPASGDAINEAAADSASSCGINETLLCIAYDTTNWEVVQLARNT